MVKSLRLLKIRRMVKSLRLLKIRRMVLKSPRLVKYQRLRKYWRHWKSKRPAYCFGSGRISNCWLLPGAADEHVLLLVNVMNLACSLQVRGELQLPCFYGRTLSCTVLAAYSGPPCQEMVYIHAATKNQAAAWNSTDSCQNTAVSNSAHNWPTLNRKIVHNHCRCPISAIILTTSNLEAVLEICRCSLKLSKRGKDLWGGDSPWHLFTCSGCRCAGYMPGDTLPTCYSCVSFSFSTFSPFRGKLGGSW